MAKIPKWLIGRGVTTFNAVPCTIGTDGTLTELTGAGMIGRLDEINVQSRNQLENISPMDDRQANPVVIESQTSLSLVEILQDTGSASGDNALALIAFNYDYIKFVFARASKTFTIYTVVEEYSESIRKGKSTGSLSVQSVSLSNGSGGYTANPLYV